ncbi:gamma-glutamyltranspeptidase 1 [Fopius arisanus]|uniref:GGT1_0 protein n=1 Tax=Fopius arisanus TaxID=64838 RepID=A0A0C9Q842_9HYME|nr:PREDICTED: gamma-glutamyltranspeptidase 1-like [Fopius arisanus]
MEGCCDVCQVTSGPSEYDVYNQSENCPLTGDQTSKCRGSSCVWRLRIFTTCLAVMCLVMIVYLVYLHSLLRTSKDFFDHGAVAADNANCSRIGTEILKNGGNAVDAAIGAMLCMTVVAPHKTGLGGGGIAIVYTGKEDTQPLVVDFATNTISGVLAPAKIRIPAVIRGLESLHTLKSSFPWRKIVEPAEILAKEGFVITEDFFEELSRAKDHGMMFEYLEPGEKLKLPLLGETLEAIKNQGSQSFYNGSIATKFLRDEFHESREDFLAELANYQPLEGKGNSSEFYGHVIYAPEHAQSFFSAVERVEHLRIQEEMVGSLDSQLAVAKALVATNVEDHDIEQERYTAVVAVDSTRNFVSILTGLSAPLGLGHMTGAGFLLDTISTGNNLHALTPIIFHLSKDPVQFSGALGADDPILATEILSNLVLNKLNLSTAIETQRYYRLSDGVLVEPRGRYSLNESLSIEISNLIPGSSTDLSQYVKSVNAIVKQGDSLSSHSDSRGGGVAFRYK